MKDFKEVLYESLLFSFGKILAEYNAFAQGTVLKDAGKEIIEYLNRNGYPFAETGTLDDVQHLVEFFAKNGFAQVEVSPAEYGSVFKWVNLYGIQAYSELQKVTENPFLSCPLNACIYYIAGKHGKTLQLHSKSFDLDTGVAYSQEEIIDEKVISGEGFDSLVIENNRLLKIAEKHETALKEALNQVNILASTDHLTGLKNRRQFLHLAEQEFRVAHRYQRNLSAIMVDIDQFKPINDTYGHAIGDEVLKKVAECCEETMRKVDILGRYGGDEFALVLPESDVSSAYQAAERLRNSMSMKSVPAEIGPVCVTLSLGIAAMSDEHTSLSSLLIDADKALYIAKNKGGNQVHCL